MAADNQPNAAARGRNMDLAAAVKPAEERYVAADPRSQAFSREAGAHIPGGNNA